MEIRNEKTNFANHWCRVLCKISSYPFPAFPYAQPITGLGEWRAVGLVKGRVSNFL